jgi:hypothetical protein
MNAQGARFSLAILAGVLTLQLALTQIPPAPATAPCQMPATLGDGWDSDSSDSKCFNGAVLMRVGMGNANIHGGVVARHSRQAAVCGQAHSQWEVRS